MIAAALPTTVATEAAYGDVPGGSDALFPQERALIRHAVPTRRGEFATVRYLARRALARIGVAAAPIVPNRRGAPQWPAGVVGSMTHCAGYRAAAVSRAEVCAAVGIDAEPNRPLPEGVFPVVTLPGERAQVAMLESRRPDVCWDRIYFSAKESVFKAWYPLTGRELDFSEAEITFDPLDATFAARLRVPGPVVAGHQVTAFHGRWLATRGLLATIVHLPMSDGTGSPARRSS